MIDYSTKWERALPFPDWIANARKNADLWRDIAARAHVADELLAAVGAIPGRWRLLVLAADWCGDAVNTVPYVAKLAALSPHLELRVVDRAAHPDLMAAHRTPRPATAVDPAGMSDSIPVVMVLDEDFDERGWWGPRPSELQDWFWTVGQTFDSKEGRYRSVRGWYARDRGVSTLAEISRLLETAAAALAARN
ncbi:MAG: thioredoxin family protein [Gemmatimonadota bacterium]